MMGGPFRRDHGNQFLSVISRNASLTISMYQTDNTESKQKQDHGEVPTMLFCVSICIRQLRNRSPPTWGENTYAARLWEAKDKGMLAIR